MNKNYPFTEIQRLLGEAKNVLICLPKSVTLDQAAAGLSLFLSLSKTGKSVNIVSPEPMTVGFSHLVGLDKITDKILGGNLVLTINTPIENVDKISTTDDGQHLSLVIAPKAGVSPITKEQIIFNQSGGGVDLVITVGARKVEGLGKIYLENQVIFQEKPIVNIDNNPQNSNFGRLNLVDLESSSCSETVAAIIQSLGLPIDEDIGSNLIQGIGEATQNFQNPKVSADTFEAAAFCLRAGGRREVVSPPKEEKKTQAAAPSDWLEPKIYKGSTLP
ncbi:MAG: DHH family phosphoesterase [Patescibacteria group bacterium]